MVIKNCFFFRGVWHFCDIRRNNVHFEWYCFILVNSQQRYFLRKIFFYFCENEKCRKKKFYRTITLPLQTESLIFVSIYDINNEEILNIGIDSESLNKYLFCIILLLWNHYLLEFSLLKKNGENRCVKQGVYGKKLEKLLSSCWEKNLGISPNFDR